MRGIKSSILNSVFHTINQLVYRNYYTAKAYYNLLLRAREKEPLIVFQMGKVGSTTIVNSLKFSGIDMSIYHTHNMTQDWIDRFENASRMHKHIHISEKLHNLHHLWESRYLLKKMNKGFPKGKKWKVISLVREPVARNVSEFFQYFNVKPLDSYRYKINYFSRVQARNYTFEINLENEDIEKLFKLFMETVNHDIPLIWFDSQLKPVFGIDVFSSDFPTSVGYKIYEGELADVLILRLENLNKCSQDAFKKFLNIDGFTLKKENIASEKPYHAIYREFLNSVTLPESYLEKMYISKYTQHFYSQEEIKGFRKKWLKNREHASEEEYIIGSKNTTLTCS